MTRKDYEIIALALWRLMPEDPERQDQWRETVEMIAVALAADNPRFDRDRFWRACGGK